VYLHSQQLACLSYNTHSASSHSLHFPCTCLRAPFLITRESLAHILRFSLSVAVLQVKYIPRAWVLLQSFSRYSFLPFHLCSQASPFTVLAHKGNVKGKCYFLMSWKGYPSSNNSWIPEKEMNNTQEILKIYKTTSKFPDSSPTKNLKHAFLAIFPVFS
jgi:hypothetical protein